LLARLARLVSDPKFRTKLAKAKHPNETIKIIGDAEQRIIGS
jgi:mannitol/fructose-specific phosphotransferase system IIA component (Ntr-type)